MYRCVHNTIYIKCIKHKMIYQYMSSYICETCGLHCKTKSNYNKHMSRKTPCKKPLELRVEALEKENQLLKQKIDELVALLSTTSNNNNNNAINNVPRNEIVSSVVEPAKTGLQRDTTDKYYTKPEVVSQCISAIKQYVNPSNQDLIIEPSAGNGAFLSGIQSLSFNYQLYDLEPEHEDIQQLDYLEFTLEPTMKTKYEKIHVIGNPPFGRQSSTAFKFIKKSCSYCDTISFILPKSFKKESMHKSFPLNFHLIYECDLPVDSFLVDGHPHKVPCVFQIWEKQQGQREVSTKLEPTTYSFVKKHESPDISFRRVGGTAGTIDKNIADKAEQSHYFIKFDKKIKETVYNKIASLIFTSRNDTVGPRSISKQELIQRLNLII